MKPHPNDPKGESGAKKTPLHLLPPYALAQTALAHREGAERYGAWNWRQTGVCATTYIGAIMRHLAAWQDGEDIDPDSGLSHIAKIGACCNILLDAEHCGKLVDDRSKVGVVQRRPAFEKLKEMQPKLLTPKQALVEAIKESLGKVVNERIANSWAAKLALELPDPEGVFVEVAMPDGLPPLPPVPEGYSKWEYRGENWQSEWPVYYAYTELPEWTDRGCIAKTAPSKGSYYIEAVK